MKEQEQKTIKQLERISSMLGIIGETEDYTDVAINALEDMQQYRILENRLSDMFGGDLTLLDVVNELERQLKEPGNPHPINARILTYEDSANWEAYKAIGTPEECLTASEKQKPKKVDHDGISWYCPNCGWRGITDIDSKYCCNCGQKLDLNNEERIKRRKIFLGIAR